jgi:hypothetical protein
MLQDKAQQPWTSNRLIGTAGSRNSLGENRSRDLVRPDDNNATRQAATELVNELWSRLLIARLESPNDRDDLEQIIRAVSYSYAQIRECYTDLSQLFSAIIAASIEVREDGAVRETMENKNQTP